MHRRDLIRHCAATASALWLPRSAWAQPRLAGNPFALGVASGSPTHESVVLWTRLLRADGRSLPAQLGDITVRWELAEDDAFSRVMRQGQVQALAVAAHSVHAEVSGLPSGQQWHYRFALGATGQDWVSPTGRTRTLPAPGAQQPNLRIAYASCQRYEHGHFAAWRHLAADKPDVVLFLGDYIYEYPGASNPVRSHQLGWCLSLDDYRRRYALYRQDAALQIAHAAAPWIVIWDDHEVQNDYAGALAGDSGPPVADFAQRRAAAYQAFYEHMPLPAAAWQSAASPALLLNGSVSLGKLGTLTWLDTRQHRDAQVCTRAGDGRAGTVDPGACPPWEDPSRSLLGVEQEAWLDQHLSRSAKSGWHLLAQTSLFGARNLRSGSVKRYWNDGWDGYPQARRRLTQGLQKHGIANPVLLGGDVHENWVGHVLADYNKPRSARIGTEFCGTSISSRSGNATNATNASNARNATNARTGAADRSAQRLAENTHFVFADTQQRGYGLLDLSSDSLNVQLRAVDDVERADSGVNTLARFHVRAGSQRIERV